MRKLYERIREKRKELGMSQLQLSVAVGYKDKSMISKIENGKVDLSQTMIAKFAEVLDVDPIWLMGLEDVQGQVYVPEEQPPDQPHTTEAKILAAGIDAMPEADRKRAIEMMYLMFDHYFPKRTEDDNAR